MAVLKQSACIFRKVSRSTPHLSSSVTVKGHLRPKGSNLINHPETICFNDYSRLNCCTDVKLTSRPFSPDPRVCPEELFVLTAVIFCLISFSRLGTTVKVQLSDINSFLRRSDRARSAANYIGVFEVCVSEEVADLTGQSISTSPVYSSVEEDRPYSGRGA
ncbi:uncharacterized protein RAG0_08796 [Rhynchosporium agropyri]|uniref:Uncharacterized protein n=1 Tax=Rhynchosporium agropyri TaxID=914238 RepID=A0A1E1KSB7_9HELO|nr:uncharacterized protein RAG0_08796 [Rhynchosporium agropyri]